MRFLADENFPRLAIIALLRQGHDVADVAIETPGLSDTEIFSRAVRESRIVLTMDKDFGEISKSTVASAACGVVLFRVKAWSFIDPVALAAIILSRRDWAGHISVVDSRAVRRRRLLLRPN